jgi:hypothetical protein
MTTGTLRLLALPASVGFVFEQRDGGWTSSTFAQALGLATCGEQFLGLIALGQLCILRVDHDNVGRTLILLTQFRTSIVSVKGKLTLVHGKGDGWAAVLDPLAWNYPFRSKCRNQSYLSARPGH